MPSSKNLDLVDSIGEALGKLNSTGALLSDVILPSDDQLTEECDILERALRKLGVVNPERMLEQIPETVEEVTDKRIATMLGALEFDSAHEKLAAQAQVKALSLPLKRVVRAARINRAVVLASIQSIKCRDWITGALLEWADGD